MNRCLLALPVLCAVLFTACVTGTDTPGQATESAEQLPSTILSVFAAASLTEAFGEIAQEFEADHPGVRVVLNLAGSQQLAQQLAQGAPADVFASADRKQIEAIVENDQIDSQTTQEFARNQLVVILPKENAARIQSLQDLASPGLHLVIADKAVPVGAYTMQFLDRAAENENLGEAFRSGFLANVVSYEENVRAVLGKVVLGEADAGIVYTTDYATVNHDGVRAMEIPDAINVTASYILAPLVDSQQAGLANEFIDFILSSRGQAVLEKYGFIPID